MKKLTKQEVFETIHRIDYGSYGNSVLDFFEDIHELTLNVTQEEKGIIIKFIKQEISFWNNTSHEYQEYGNFIYKNIITNSNETVIKIYKADSDDDIRKITTLTLIV